MSIYATLWSLKFPRDGDDYIGCEWVEVWAQGVPEHIGRPTAGTAYERGDPYASFLPVVGWEEPSESEARFRAVVFVTPDTPKGTDGHQGQEYADPLLVLSGAEYRSIPFGVLHDRLCDALRSGRPKVTGQLFVHGKSLVLLDDGSSRDVEAGLPEPRSPSKGTDKPTRPWWRFW
jgi:hypothetical protein